MLRKTLLPLLLSALGALPAHAGDGAQALIDQGNRLWSENRIEQAEARFKEAIAEAPEDARAHARLAALYLTQNRPAEAISAYQEAITHDPENPRLFMGLSIAYLHQQAYGMAAAMAKEALRLDPQMANARKMREYIAAKQAALAATAGGTRPADHP